MEARDALTALAFGPFILDRSRKQLLENDRPLRLGGRAFDLLAALTERAGEVLSRPDLEAQVRPHTIVEETSLRVHISALRKILGDGIGGARYIANVPGRGYSFVVPVTLLDEVAEPAATATAPTVAGATLAPARRPHNLPARLNHAIGRSGITHTLGERLATRRLVSIVGPGGMGKTTVALAVAEGVLGRYADGVWFVDLAPLTDPARVPRALASALQISVSADDPWATLRDPLRDARMLIVLDNCEHVIAAAAELVERVLREAPGVHILTTSREALEAEGEWVHRLAALEAPVLDDTPGLERALVYPAIQLFVERATANSDAFALTEANLPVVAHLCRQLDGMPLAIELAAGRIDSLGLQGLADRLDEMFALLTRGRRTVLPRHRTLQALLDWSHDLLTDVERVVLRRLSMFRRLHAGDGRRRARQRRPVRGGVVDGVMGLAAKSLVAVDVSGETVLHRLLYTTRTYAADKLARSGEGARVADAHAAHFQEVLARRAACSATPADRRMAAPLRPHDGRRARRPRLGLRARRRPAAGRAPDHRGARTSSTSWRCSTNTAAASTSPWRRSARCNRASPRWSCACAPAARSCTPRLGATSSRAATSPASSNSPTSRIRHRSASRRCTACAPTPSAPASTARLPTSPAASGNTCPTPTSPSPCCCRTASSHSAITTSVSTRPRARSLTA